MRRTIIAASLSAFLSASASAGSWEVFTVSSWDELQGRGGVVLLHFSSPDCGVCKNQKNALRRLLTEDPELAVTGLQTNLGATPDLESRYGVMGASTMVLLRDGREIAKSIGMTSPEDIRDFVDQAFLLKRWGAPKGRPSNRLPLRP